VSDIVTLVAAHIMGICTGLLIPIVYRWRRGSFCSCTDCLDVYGGEQ